VAQVFRLARDERDAWVNWPARGSYEGCRVSTSTSIGCEALQMRDVLELA
jgi:hypothetical protein